MLLNRINKLIYKIRSNRINFFCISLIIFLSIWAVIALFKKGLPLLGQDTVSPISPEFRFKSWLHIWEGNLMMGTNYPTRIVLLFPEIFLFFILGKIGFSLVVIQKIVYSQIFLVSGLGMYFLYLTIFGKKYFAALVAAIVYMFNPVQLGFWYAFLVESSYIIAFYPLILAMFIRGLKSSTPLKAAFLFALSTIFCSAASPPLYLLIFVSMVIFLFYYLFFSPGKNRRNLMVFLFFSVLLSFVFNFWWFWPSLKEYSSEVKALETYTDQEGRLYTSSERATTLNSFILKGSNYNGFSIWGDKISNFAAYKEDTSFLFIFLSFIYPVLAFLPLLFKENRKAIIYLLIVTSLVFIFLSKGVYGQAGLIYQQLYQLVPGFSIYRTPSDKFPIVTALCYSLLIGVSTASLRSYFKKKAKILSWSIPLIIIFLLLIAQWPFLTGDEVHQGKSAFPPTATKIPDSYQQASGWLNEKSEIFRIFNFPGAEFSSRWMVYRWGYLGNYLFLSDVLQRPIVDKPPFSDNDQIRWLSYILLGNYSGLPGDLIQRDYLNFPKTLRIDRLLSLMNIRYLLFNRDTDFEHLHFGTESEDILKSNLEEQKGLKLDKIFGNLEFYKIKEENFLPRIYSANKKAYFNGNINNLGDVIDFLPQGKIEINFNDPEINSLRNSDILLISRPESSSNEYRDVSFPYSRISPGNPLYWFIRWKEKRELSRAQNEFSKTLLQLYYSHKRLTEISKMVENNKYSNLEEILKDYLSLIEEISLKTKSGSIDDKDLLFFTLQLDFKKQQDYLLGLANRSSPQYLQNFERALLYLKKISKEINTYEIVKNDEQNFFRVKIPDSGDYEIYLYLGKSNGSLLKNLKIQGSMDSVNGSQIKGEKIKNVGIFNDDWLYLGKHFLEVKDYYLDLEYPEVINVLTIDKEIELRPIEGKLNFWLPINGLQPGKTYRISFDYKSNKENFREKYSFWQYLGLSQEEKEIKLVVEKEIDPMSLSEMSSQIRKSLGVGNHIRVALKREVVQSVFESEPDLDSFSEWNHRETVLQLHPQLKYGGLFFNTETALVADDKLIRLKNIKIQEVLSPILILKKKSEILNPSPDIDFKQKSPSQYLVEIKGNEFPFTLIFSETYHQGWKAYLKSDKGKIPIPEEKHFLVNGYANGWRIEKTDAREIILEFVPQKSVFYGMIFSIFSIITLVFYYFCRNLNKK